MLAPLSWIVGILLNVTVLPYRLYLKLEPLIIFLTFAGIIGFMAGLTVYVMSTFTNRLLHLEGHDDDVDAETMEELEQRPYMATGVDTQSYTGAQRSVSDFRAARKRRKEEEYQDDEELKNQLRWLPGGGQAHIVPLIKEARKGAAEDRTRLPLMQETILEVDSSTDLDFG